MNWQVKIHHRVSFQFPTKLVILFPTQDVLESQYPFRMLSTSSESHPSWKVGENMENPGEELSPGKNCPEKYCSGRIVREEWLGKNCPWGNRRNFETVVQLFCSGCLQDIDKISLFYSVSFFHFIPSQIFGFPLRQLPWGVQSRDCLVAGFFYDVRPA